MLRQRDGAVRRGRPVTPRRGVRAQGVDGLGTGMLERRLVLAFTTPEILLELGLSRSNHADLAEISGVVNGTWRSGAAQITLISQGSPDL